MLNHYLLDTTCLPVQKTISSELRDKRLTAPNITPQLDQCSEKEVSTSTVRRRLCKADLYGRIEIQKPLLRKQDNVKKFQRVKVHKDWTIEQWNKFLWTEKFKFEIFGSNRRVYARWIVGERASTHCIKPTVKLGGGSVMVWRGAFDNRIVVDLPQLTDKLNQTGYHSIQQHHTIPNEMWLVGQGFVIMQGNDPKHTNKLSQRYIKRKRE